MFKPIYIYDINILEKLDWFALRRNRHAKDIYDEITINCSDSHPIITRYMKVLKKLEIDKPYEEYSYFPDDDMYPYSIISKEDIADNNIRLLSCNPNAINYLEKNINDASKIDWHWLSTNPLAIHLLKANPDKINYKMLSLNINVSSIFDLNTEKMRQKAERLKVELISIVLDPDRLERLCKCYNICLRKLLHIYN